MKFLIYAISAIFFLACQTHSPKADSCSSIRAAFDIGSGETKLKVAKVDICKSKIEAVLLEAKRDINFKAELSKNSNGELPDSVLTAGTQAIVDLKKEALAFNPSQYAAVATAAFREAKNGKAFVEKVSQDLGVHGQVISQQTEGLLGLYAVKAKVPNMKPESSVVWDVGGGSQQLVMETETNGQKTPLVYEGTLASVSFKNELVKNIQKKKSDSPNPLSAMHARRGVDYAEKIAKETVGSEFKKAIQQGFTVYGIGGVHNFSIQGQLPKKGSYGLEDVNQIIQSRLVKSDKMLGNGNYVDTDTSNPLLIKGFMQALEIKSVEVIKVNLADGLLIHPQYWNKN